MVEVIVSRLGLDGQSNAFVVILQEKGGDRILPIVIGRAEAESIAQHLNGVRRERPMTHDLCQSLIVTLGGTLQRVQVTRVEDNTFYAEMHVLSDGTVHVVDARPSDSIAIALRLEAPIFAAEDLLAELEIAQEGDAPAADETEAESEADPESPESQERSAEQLQRHLERLRPEDFGKFKL